jgi:hypothetical protein
VQGREDYERCDRKGTGPRSQSCGRRKTHTYEIQSEIMGIMNFILFSSDRRPTLLKKINSVALVRERTIPNDRLLLVGEVSAKFWE